MGFSVQNGQIIGPNGQAFIAKGINIGDWVLSQAVGNSSAQPLTTDFPGINFVRLDVAPGGAANSPYGDLDSPSSIKQYVNWATSRGIVVEIEYHPFDQTLTGSALNTVASWYGEMAATFRANPYVWFGTQNEPPDTSGNAVSNEMTAIYHAIRNAGDTAPILLTPHGGGDDTNGMSASAIAGMSNVVWDLHYYNWVSNYSASQSANNIALANEISTFQHFTTEAGGSKIPVIIGEYGNSTDGANIDPGWQQTVTAVETNHTISGSAAFGWNPGGNADWLFNNNNPSDRLSAYGQMVAGYIHSGSSGSGTGSGGDPKPSPSGTVITPGHGSFTDASGNTYSLTAGEVAMENGAPIAGGGGTGRMEFYNGHVYGEDATTGNWYTWNQSDWSPASAPPSTAAVIQSAAAAADIAPSPSTAAVQPATTPTTATAMPAALQTEQPTVIPSLH